jgi:hypothetical protein
MTSGQELHRPKRCHAWCREVAKSGFTPRFQGSLAGEVGTSGGGTAGLWGPFNTARKCPLAQYERRLVLR